MKKPIKAALLSALIYPGAGHLLIKKYFRGSVWAILFSIPLFLILIEVINKTNQIIEQIVAKIERGEIPLELFTITESVSNLTSDLYSPALNIKLYLMFIIWLIAILDIYQVTKKVA